VSSPLLSLNPIGVSPLAEILVAFAFERRAGEHRMDETITLNLHRVKDFFIRVFLKKKLEMTGERNVGLRSCSRGKITSLLTVVSVHLNITSKPYFRFNPGIL